MVRLGGDPGDPPDDAFPSFLDRGSEALRGGDPAAAREALERALELRPKDAKALALLGQACYRQGRYDDASAAWQRLVNDNPVEPAARVNLGLAFLKAKRHAEARKQLEIALDFEPEHRKAMNYLGLALLESGSPVDAREWFRKAGSEQMVARCDDVIAGGWQTLPPPAAAEASAASVPAEPEPLRTPLPAAIPSPGRASADPAPRLDAWTAARRAQLTPGGPFVVQDGVLVVAVRGELCVRALGLLALRGRVALAGELKRFRGHATDRAFGEGARAHAARERGGRDPPPRRRAPLHRARARRRGGLPPRGGGVRLRGWAGLRERARGLLQRCRAEPGPPARPRALPPRDRAASRSRSRSRPARPCGSR